MVVWLLSNSVRATGSTSFEVGLGARIDIFLVSSEYRDNERCIDPSRCA